MNVRDHHLGAAALVLALVGTTTALAQPGTIAVQGSLRTAAGGPAADGQYAMTVRLYDGAKATKPAWEESFLSVIVSGGRFALTLGRTKLITAALLAGLKSPHLGVAVFGGAELPRVLLSSIPYALHATFATEAAVARKLSCTGCLTPAQFKGGAVPAAGVSFTFAGSTTKGGPATKALDLDCKGCVSTARELAYDGNMKLGAHALNAAKVTAEDIVGKTVSATSFVGDGSKLTGIQTVAGQCDKAGEVVKGVKSDGSLVCIKAMDVAALPRDGLDEISNGVLSGEFINRVDGTAKLAIPDNRPDGVTDTIDVPDFGTAKKLTVRVNITNSDASRVKVLLFDPLFTPPAAISNADLGKLAHYLLYDGGKAKGAAIKLTLPSPDKPVSGDLDKWIGHNPKGKWRLIVIDSKTATGKNDGAVQSWSIEVHTVSKRRVKVNGSLQIAGGATVDGMLRLPRLDKPPLPCSGPDALGHVYADTKLKQLRFCDGSKWQTMLAWGLGESPESAGVSCKELMSKGAHKSGVYWVKPFGTPIRAYCDMKLLSGGWTMVFKYSTASRYSRPAAQWNKPHNVGDVSLLDTGSNAKLYSMGAINVPGAKELVAVVYRGGTAVTWFGFSLSGNDLNATWKKGRVIANLTRVNLSSFDAGLIYLGAGSCREFYITHNHGGCGNDAGALVVNSKGCGPGCSWERSDTIHWWGGPGDYRNYTNGIHKDGEVLALLVR